MMNSPEKPEWVKQIEREAGGKAVLLVEGATDIRILSYFLDKLLPSWNTTIELFPVGSKSKVIKAIKTYHPEWVGIVDRDEWSPEYVVKQTQVITRIKVLPRFCLENYFCVPEELWNALPQPFKHALYNKPEHLKKPLLDVLPDWIAHGAMWRVIRNRHTTLVYESKFPTEFDSKPITDENEIRRILEVWHEQLDPDQILREYREELVKAKTRPLHEKLTDYIHGKKFFEQVVTPTLNTLFGQVSSDTWLERFTQGHYGVSLPSDLHSFLQQVLSLLR